jgi:trk system potassium uptake protein TrkA
LAKRLTAVGHDVMALDRDRRQVDSISPHVTHAIQADVTSESVLDEIGIQKFDIAVVAIGSDIKASVLATILVKKLGVKYVIARANDDVHADILRKIGADTVVSPEQESGERLAQGITLFHVSDYMSVSPGYGISKIVTPTHMKGRKLGELGFAPDSKFRAPVVLLQKENEIIANPGVNTSLTPGDVLYVIAEHEKLEKLLAEAIAS